MSDNFQKTFVQNFLKHQKLWGAALLVGWFTINMVVLATTILMEHSRDGKPLAAWEAFCWEISSIVLVLLLIPVGIWVNDRWLAKVSFKARLLLHVLATLPFSIVHVAGMVAIRYFWYSFMGSQYRFGELPLEFFYEYRKDAQAYLTISLVVFGYRLIVRRLQGEASYLAESDEAESQFDSEPQSPPEHLLIKKLGREFLIKTSDIEWIEASGNYANLHIKTHVYPMRVTMEKLEKRLPDNFLRIHRSTIVNIKHIKEVEALDSGDHQVRLLGGIDLVLSRRYRESFKNLLSLA